MAENSQEVHREVGHRVEAQAEKLSRGNRFEAEQARALVQGLNEMNAALRETQRAVEALRVKKPEDAERAKETFRREVKEALTALRNTLVGHERDAALLVQKTRQELENLGALAQRGPETKPRLMGLLGHAEKIDEWLQEADRDPQKALDDMMGYTRSTVDEIQTDVPTEGARRDGVIAANRGMNALARYLSGSTTEERMREMGQ